MTSDIEKRSDYPDDWMNQTPDKPLWGNPPPPPKPAPPAEPPKPPPPPPNPKS